MSTVTDIAIAASIILDIIEVFQKKGINVTVANLEEEIKKREKAAEELSEALGLNDI